MTDGLAIGDMVVRNIRPDWWTRRASTSGRPPFARRWCT